MVILQKVTYDTNKLADILSFQPFVLIVLKIDAEIERKKYENIVALTP